jgi:hypothetical protein
MSAARSEILLLITRPRTVLDACVANDAAWTSIALAYAAPLVAIGAFSSYSYVGAVTIGHTLANVLAYLALFVVQAAIAVALARVFLRQSIRRALHAFALTYLPLEIFFVGLLALFLIAPDPYDALIAAVRTYILPGAFAIVLVWSAFLTYVAFRSLSGGRILRAVLCTIAHYGAVAGIITAYVVAMGLLPLPMGRL